MSRNGTLVMFIIISAGTGRVEERREGGRRRKRELVYSRRIVLNDPFALHQSLHPVE